MRKHARRAFFGSDRRTIGAILCVGSADANGGSAATCTIISYFHMRWAQSLGVPLIVAEEILSSEFARRTESIAFSSRRNGRAGD